MKKKYDVILLDSGYGIWEEDVDVTLYKESCKDSNKDSNKDSKDNHGQEEQKSTWVECEETDDFNGHGTSVLSIISNEYKGSYAVFQVFQADGVGNLERIKSALEFIIDKCECSYVQMSFGLRGYDRELEELCWKLYQKGTIIIAAFDNNGAMSFPAAYEFVIGVSGHAYIKRADHVVTLRGNVVDVLAKSGFQILKAKSEKGFSIGQGNSFAASYVTRKLLLSQLQFDSKLSAMRYLNPEYEEIKQKNSSGVINSKIAIFPLNKEMRNLIHYASELKVDLVDVYDIKYAAQIGTQVDDFDGTSSYIVKNIDKCEWESFDTFVIGHLRELNMLLGKNIKKDLLEKCLAHGKHVYSYDTEDLEEYRKRFEERGLRLESPEDYELDNPVGKLYQFRTPVLAVLGTSKKQGKFTLQMQLHRVMRENGAKLGHLGTEPNSLLLGCDEVLPLGYDAKLSHYRGEDIIELVNRKMHVLDKKDFDMILVGGQSGFYPYLKYDTSNINMSQTAFLYATCPDGVILCVNFTDPLDYIEQTIKAIEAISGSKVFLLSLYAFKMEKDYVIHSEKRKLTEDEIAEKKTIFAEKFGLKTVVAGDKSYNDMIFEEILKYYQ